VIDLHSHILPALDDGARALEESIEMAESCVAEGITAIAATPHVRADYPTTPLQMEASLSALRVELDLAQIPLDVLPGGEIDLDYLDTLSTDDLRRYGLGGNPAYLLLEFPYYGWPLSLQPHVEQLREMGITAVIAHPERSTEIQDEPERLGHVAHAGALIQVTAASLDGRLGKTARKAALDLIELELVHLIGSDAHHGGLRHSGLAAAAEAVEDSELARWLTVEMPRAIVDGTELPPRPQRPRRRRGFFGLG
jgi:protein-tyrosine phosphatase